MARTPADMTRAWDKGELDVATGQPYNAAYSILPRVQSEYLRSYQFHLNRIPSDRVSLKQAEKWLLRFIQQRLEED